MWDFKKFFHPAAWSDSLASDNPAIETFHGPKPFSEPETQNVRWLMDRFNPVLFLDLHSYDGDVLFSWGSDENQITDPSQNFMNPAYDGKRGRIGDTYREYLSVRDYETATGNRDRGQRCDAGCPQPALQAASGCRSLSNVRRQRRLCLQPSFGPSGGQPRRFPSLSNSTSRGTPKIRF